MQVTEKTQIYRKITDYKSMLDGISEVMNQDSVKLDMRVYIDEKQNALYEIEIWGKIPTESKDHIKIEYYDNKNEAYARLLELMLEHNQF